jgi:Family of unknown function (DUF6502)
VKNTSNQNAALVEFLTEFAKYMISSGVSLAEFQSAARAAFLQAAMGRARLRNSRVNQSALAAITGLNRSQVRAILHEWEDGPAPQSSRLAAVLDAWQFDPQFHPGSGIEHRLPIRGDQGSFSALVQKYCGDVSYKAVLTELKKLGYVLVQDGDVVLTLRGKEHFEPREIRQLSSGLAFTLRSDTPITSEMAVITAEAIYKSPSPKSRLLIKKRLAQSTKAFAADIRAAGEAEASKSPRGPNRKTRSSIFVLTVDQGE